MEDAVQSLVTHLLSSSSTLPLKRLAVTTSPPASTVTTRPQGTSVAPSSNSHDHLVRVLRRPHTESVTCSTVSSTANPIQPVIFNLPMGNPGGLLIVRNPQPEPTVPVVTVSQPAMAHGWSPFMPRPGVGQPSSAAGTSRQLPSANYSPPNSGNFLLESPQVISQLSTSPISGDDRENAELNVLGKPAFDLASFPSVITNDSQITPEEADSKSSLSSDVLDDLLHIVNESLGPVTDDTDPPSLPDYDLAAALDDDNSLISMVVSPNSEVPASTVARGADDVHLAKIMDYCPEWSYVEVFTYLMFFIIHVCVQINK